MSIGQLLGASVVLAAVLVASARAVDKGHTTDPIDEVKAKVEAKKAILVDVREQKEWDGGHIKDAVLIPLSRLRDWEKGGMTAEEKAELHKALPEGSLVYCHCRAGARALTAGEMLRKLGYDARPLKPGYGELVKAGFPHEPGKK